MRNYFRFLKAFDKIFSLIKEFLLMQNEANKIWYRDEKKTSHVKKLSK